MKKIDLIIPTYNRPDFLERILDYYNSYGKQFNIIIADSSKSINKKRNKRIVNSFQKLKILYVDKFDENLPSHHKYAKMLKYTQNKYVCFCPDDDFITPKGIEEAVNFLEKNPLYSVAHGTYISFYLHKNLFGPKQFWWRFIYPFESITYSKPIDRLAAHIKNYNLVLWAVRRTDVVKIAYKEFLRSGADPFLFGELTPDMLTLIYGKMKRLETFYAARQAFSTSYNYWPSLMDAMNEDIYESEYTKFKNCLLNNLAKISEIPKKEASMIIDSSMKIYLKKTSQEHMTGRINLKLKHLPLFFSDSLRFLHITYLFSKETRDKIGDISKSSSKYFTDFTKIRNCVLKH